MSTTAAATATATENRRSTWIAKVVSPVPKTGHQHRVYGRLVDRSVGSMLSERLCCGCAAAAAAVACLGERQMELITKYDRRLNVFAVCCLISQIAKRSVFSLSFFFCFLIFLRGL